MPQQSKTPQAVRPNSDTELDENPTGAHNGTYVRLERRQIGPYWGVQPRPTTWLPSPEMPQPLLISVEQDEPMPPRAVHVLLLRS